MWTPFVDGNGAPQAQAAFEQTLLLKCLAADREDLATRIAGQLGASVQFWHWAPNGPRPSWALYATADGHCLVTVSGTQNKRQIILHLGGAIPVFPIPGVGQVQMLHWALAKEVAEAVEGHLPEGAVGLDWSGHSYGGSMVTLLSAVSGSGPVWSLPSQYMTFGAPRSFFASRLPTPRGPLVRVSGQNDDPVAHMPPKHLSVLPGVGWLTKKLLGLTIEWQHLGLTVHVTDDGTWNVVGKNVDDEGIIDLAKSMVTGWFNHPIAAYLRRVAQIYR